MDINEIYTKWKAHEISDEAYALSFFLYFHQMKYPNSKLLNVLNERQPTYDDLTNFKFKKVKEKALIALKNWVNGSWNFKALDYIPTPYEVLAFQAQGIRPVTLKVQHVFNKILTREDCLEFFLHDLEHGHMFFFDEELKNMQINFFEKVHLSCQSSIWDEYLHDKEFKEKFYYLISDMNTHQEHYRQFLGAMLPREDVAKFDFLF
ncbi:hypothetical protein [Bacteriovorax sp. Seq25_V]|uniref:hypothetical protein n=1 Tax=Bacteriovorax sp. Seq25_V TaxID=1201288 RepID=UPI00038A510D|nr:hypothetical protein [Bacteriovorax sp. Seq25_V]EQC44789.1 hypothetical protein M900_0446 [Bacteriovorax sp. Seq25_V]